MTPSAFAEALQSYCGWSGGSVTSYGRSAARNAYVGGAEESRHLLWLAADVIYYPNEEPNMGKAQRMARKLGIRVIREDDHDHIQSL